MKTSPVCLTSDGVITVEMEKVLNAMPMENGARAERVLEINPSHPVFETISALDDDEKIKLYAKLLYNQALLIEGLPIDDPVEFSNNICLLMTK